MHTSSKNSLADQCGFTLLEMMIATAIMLLGFVGVAQLVPVAMNSNWLNRDDSTKLVLAQRELNEMIDQLNQSMAAASFTDDQNNQGSLANGGNPTITINNRPVIDFNAAPVANYSFNYTDVSGVVYDVRWAITNFTQGGNVTGKRIILGVGRRAPVPRPVNLDTMVQK